MRRILPLLIFGLAGLALLVGLGIWQVQRLAWKEGVLAEIEARISAAPVGLPETATAADRYLPDLTAVGPPRAPAVPAVGTEPTASGQHQSQRSHAEQSKATVGLIPTGVT